MRTTGSTWRWPRSATGSCWRVSDRRIPPFRDRIFDVEKVRTGLRGSAEGATLGPMAEEPIAFLRAAQSPAARTANSGGQGFTVAQVRFDRAELNRILTL